MATITKLVDTTKCIACRGCMVACKNWNQLPAVNHAFQGSYQSQEGLTAHTWCLIKYKEHEDAQGNMHWNFIKDACKHCHDAACVKACPQESLFYTELGTVSRDWDKCVGCGYCETHCPFGVIQVVEYTEDGRAIIDDAAYPMYYEEPGNMKGVRKSEYKGKVVKKSNKCDMCYSRITNGRQPACVTSCPSNALVFGERSAMLAEAESRLAILKQKNPNANIYNPSSINGTNTIYILNENPEYYDLPAKPVVPVSLSVWKDIVHPVGKLAFGAGAVVVATSFIVNKVKKGGSDAEGTHAEGGEA